MSELADTWNDSPSEQLREARAEIAKLKAERDEANKNCRGWYNQNTSLIQQRDWAQDEAREQRARAESLQAELARLKAPAISNAGYYLPPGPDQGTSLQKMQTTSPDQAEAEKLAERIEHEWSDFGRTAGGLVWHMCGAEIELILSRLRSSPAPAATATTSTDREPR